MTKIPIEYFEKLNWKTAGWKHRLFIDGQTSHGQRFIEIHKDKQTGEYSVTLPYSTTNKEYKGNSLGLTYFLNLSPFKDQLLQNNLFNISIANTEIQHKSDEIVAAGQATKKTNEDKDLALMDIELVEVYKDWGDVDEYHPTKDYQGTTAALLKTKDSIHFNPMISIMTISKLAGLYCRKNNIEVFEVLEDGAQYPIKYYPAIILQTAINVLLHKRDEMEAYENHNF